MRAPAWPLAVDLASLPLTFPDAVAVAARLGFTRVDVVALAERPLAHLEALADAGVLVGAAALGTDLPPDATLDALDLTARRRAVETVRLQIIDAARLGALTAHLDPPLADSDSLAAFADACSVLADFAAGRMIRLALRPVPGTALATAADLLAWLERVGETRLGLSLDVSACLAAGEDPAAVVLRAGQRLTSVAVGADNPRGVVAPVAAALGAAGYRGAVSLCARGAADPVAALREGGGRVERWLQRGD